MKRMLFNATHPEELRVAIVDGQQLIDLDIESAVRAEKKGNIYKAVVTKVEPGLEAAFVDYGTTRQGFLPFKEIYRGYFAEDSAKTAFSQIKIAEVIKEGQELIVQVDKDERGNKGAALTSFISLAGRFLVLMPNNPKGGGISRRVSGEERMDLRQIVADLNVDTQHALIARTAGIGRSPEELQWDLDFLLKLWSSIETSAAELKAPRLIYQESNLIVRSIRDHLAADIDEIIIDDREIYERAQRFLQQMMPHNPATLQHYTENMPLFSRFQVEHQIESAFNRVVVLPSGGSMVIDHTEALISIDVNSARAKGADIEETALQTNLEAADEVARQLRIRDIGGLVVIDLIDMEVSRNQRAVESRFHTALKLDRARVRVGKISGFGLLQMSRQRLRASISDANYRSCPRCHGTGTIRNVISASLSLLRLMEEKLLHENTEALQIAVPLDMATYLLNEKRHEIHRLETRMASRIIMIPTSELSSPQFQIKHLRKEDMDELSDLASYQQHIEIDNAEDTTASLKSTTAEEPQIHLHQIEHEDAPVAKFNRRKTTAAHLPSGGGWLRRLWNALTRHKPTHRAMPQNKSRYAKSTAPSGRGRRSQQSRRARGGAQQGRAGRDNSGGNRRQQPQRGAASQTQNVRSGARGNSTTQAESSTNAQPRNGRSQKPSGAQSRRRPMRPPQQPKTPVQSTEDMPDTPTRRDFAAHEPSQRVGRYESRNSSSQTAPSGQEKPQDTPEDGNKGQPSTYE